MLMAKIFRQLCRSPRARALAALLMAYAVLLPVYGPLIDPTFAERQPFHQHVYPNGYVVSHVHAHEAAVQLDGGADVTGGVGDVIALPFGDIATSVFAAVLVALGVTIALALRLVRIDHVVDRLRDDLAATLDPPPPRRLLPASA